MRTRAAAAPLAAYVLHQYDWSESSQIVDLFTRDAGRVVVAARGAKRPTSQLRAVLMPFQRLAVAVSGAARDEASAEVRNLRSAEWAGGMPVRGGDALLAGFYLNELLLRLLARDDPHPQLWDAYAATLGHLGTAAEAPALRAFELVLLAETGHLPDLSRVTSTAEGVATGRHYLLRPEAGLANAGADTPGGLDGAVWASLHSAVVARDLEALRAACAGCEGALRRQLRQCLAYHLAGATLHTRELVRDLQTLTAA